MQPTADFDASKLARSLLRRSRQGALATLMPESGDPYCSLVNVASHADASPILLGGTDLDRPADRRLEPEPRGMAVLTVLLMAICLGIGLYPQLLLATINEAIRGLTFIQPL